MSTTVNPTVSPSKWQATTALVLLFWLSSSLLLDFVVMPELYLSGMTNLPGFASAGYSIFWLFNRIEVICAALILTGLLVLHQGIHLRRWILGLAAVLLAIALVDTYLLTPQMSALGLQLDLFQPFSTDFGPTMQAMQWSYWFLDVCKLAIGGTILFRSFRLS